MSSARAHQPSPDAPVVSIVRVGPDGALPVYDRGSMDDATRLALVAQQGGAAGRHALESLIRMTQADVWRFCARLTDRSRADDLTQEVYLRAWRSLDRFRVESSARAWLLGIARHVVFDDVRRHARRERLARGWHPGERADSAGSEPDPAALVAAEDLVAGLDLDQRTAFVLTQVIGLSYADAAEACGVPVGTIRSRVARARDVLISRLGEETG